MLFIPITRECLHTPPIPSLTRPQTTRAHVVIQVIVDRICCPQLYHHTYTPRAYAHTSRGRLLLQGASDHGQPQLYD